jgi:hypothetical protein
MQKLEDVHAINALVEILYLMYIQFNILIVLQLG